MPWTAPPPPERVEPPGTGDPRAQLEAFLTYQRHTLLGKCAGLTADQLRERAVPPSSLSLLGLLRHLTDVERSWFRRRLDGQDIALLHSTETDQDADFDRVDTADAEADHAAFLVEVEACGEVARRHRLDDTFVRGGTGEVLDLHWVYLHMLEEYARHNGHADLLRERIDGATGE